MNLKRLIPFIRFFLLFFSCTCTRFLGSNQWEDILKESTDTEEKKKGLNDSQTVIRALPEKSSVYGQPVSFNVNVISTRLSSKIPSGTIRLEINQEAIETKPLNSYGRTKFKISTLSATSLTQHLVTAVYSGDDYYAPSKGALFYNVLPVKTTAALRSSPNPSFFGQKVEFDFEIDSVKPGTAIPNGIVNFQIDLGRGTEVNLDSKGHAIFSSEALPMGTHTVTATFEGNENFNAAVADIDQQVDKANTITQIFSERNPTLFGENALIKAKVSSNSGQPSGKIQFLVNGREYDKPVMVDNNGEAAITINNLLSGNHTIDAEYLGDRNFDFSHAFLIQKVDIAATQAEILSSDNPAIYGQAISITAKISSNNQFPEGYIQFKVDGIEYGKPQVLSRNGQMTVDFSKLKAGSHKIDINYLGSDNFLPSSASLIQKIHEAKTTASLQSWPNPSLFGQPVQFIAEIDSEQPGTATPEGIVSFQIDGKKVKGVNLDRRGRATFISSELPVGKHDIKAIFEQNESFKSSNVETNQQVDKAKTITHLTSSADPSIFGQEMTFKATVTAEGVRPTGQIQFSVDGKKIGNPEYLSYSGESSITVQDWLSGNYNVEASYLGDKNFEPSSDYLNQRVELARTQVEIISSRNPAQESDSIEVTVKITSNNLMPAGNIQLRIDGKDFGNALPLSRDGDATINLNKLSPGSHRIDVDYLGNENFTPSRSSLIQKIVIDNKQPQSTE